MKCWPGSGSRRPARARFLGMYWRVALWRGGAAQGTAGDDALGIVSFVAVFRRDPRERASGGGRRTGFSPLVSRRESTVRCGSPPSCAATRPRRPSNSDMVYAPEPPFNSGTPETAPPAILEQARQSVQAGSRRSGKRPRDVSPPNSASPFQPRGRGMISLTQHGLARTEGVLAHPPTAALLNRSQRDQSPHPSR